MGVPRKLYVPSEKALLPKQSVNKLLRNRVSEARSRKISFFGEF